MKTTLRYAWAAFTAGMFMYTAGLVLFYFSGQGENALDASFTNAPVDAISLLGTATLAYGLLGLAAFYAVSKEKLSLLVYDSLVIIAGTILALTHVLPLPFMENFLFAPIFIILSVASVFYSYKTISSQKN